jgi:hypothetical protein
LGSQIGAGTTKTGRHSVRTATFAPRLEHHKSENEEGIKMKKFGFATIAATGLAAVIVGLAAPAQTVTIAQAPTATISAIDIATGIDHHTWLDDIQPQVNVPQVDTSVQQSR